MRIRPTNQQTSKGIEIRFKDPLREDYFNQLVEEIEKRSRFSEVKVESLSQEDGVVSLYGTIYDHDIQMKLAKDYIFIESSGLKTHTINRLITDIYFRIGVDFEVYIDGEKRKPKKVWSVLLSAIAYESGIMYVVAEDEEEAEEEALRTWHEADIDWQYGGLDSDSVQVEEVNLEEIETEKY